MSRREAILHGLPPTPAGHRPVHDAFVGDVFHVSQTNWGPRWQEYSIRCATGEPAVNAKRTLMTEESALAWAAVFAVCIVCVTAAFGIAKLVDPDALGIADRNVWRSLLILGAGGAIAVVFAALIFISNRPQRHVKFTDPQSNLLVMTLLQKEGWQFARQTFTLVLPGGPTIAVFRRNLFRHAIRSTWHIYSPDGTTLLWSVTEASLFMAVVRRLLLMMTRFSSRTLPNFSFVFSVVRGGRTVARLDRRHHLRDQYTLDLSADATRELDRRIAIAMAVMLDSAEGR